MQPLILTNQFGEESINTIGSPGGVTLMPLGGDLVLMRGTGAPTSGASGTGDNIAGKGSIYVDVATGLWYQQQGAITSPSWVLIESGNAAIIAALLTGFSAGAGTVAGTDTILQGFNKLAGNTQKACC